MKPGLGPQWHGDHARAAGADDPFIGRVDRLGDDDLVTRAGEALQCAIEPALGPRHDGDVVNTARLPGAPRDPRRDRLAHRRIAENRRITGAVPAQRRHGRLDDRFGRFLIGVADGQEDDVLAGIAALCGFVMDGPGAGAVPGDPLDERRIAHRGPSPAPIPPPGLSIPPPRLLGGADR